MALSRLQCERGVRMSMDRVTWTNVNWDAATLEIRRGNNADPSANEIVALPTLLRHDSHVEESSGEDFYWVRTDPASDGVYIHRPCYGTGAEYEEVV
jgi:hypothetical protein